MLVSSLCRSDDRNGHPGRLRPRVAEHFLRPSVPVGDLAVKVGGDDGVFGTLHNCRQAPKILLLAPSLGRFAFEVPNGPRQFLGALGYLLFQIIAELASLPLGALALFHFSHHGTCHKGANGRSGQERKQDQPSGEAAGFGVVCLALIASLLHLELFEPRESIPSVMQSIDLKNHIARHRYSCLLEFTCLQQVGYAGDAICRGGPLLIELLQELSFRRGFNSLTQCLEDVRDVLDVEVPLVQKRRDLLLPSGENRSLQEPIVQIGIGGGLLRQLNLSPASVIDVVEVGVDSRHAVEP